MSGGNLVVRIQGDSAAAPVRKVGEDRFSASGQTITLITGRDGKTRYLMAGSRAYKRQG